MNLIVKQIDFGSTEYFQSLGLRYEVLRRPLGLHFDAGDLKKEFQEIHIAAFVENQIVGCLILSEITNDNLIFKMRQVAVDDKFQRLGIGKQMVAFSENISKLILKEKIELHARKSAVPFYLSLNYHQVGEEFLEVNIPHYKMFKSLKKN